MQRAVAEVRHVAIAATGHVIARIGHRRGDGCNYSFCQIMVVGENSIGPVTSNAIGWALYGFLYNRSPLPDSLF